MNYSIPFNKPHLTGKEMYNISLACQNGKISGNGHFSQLCQSFFQNSYHFKKCLLTTSCTDALEMAALLLEIKEGDEVIMPAFTFVSTANAFVLRGAKIVFADSRPDFPGIDESTIENLINSHTKAIVVVHYAGIATNMDFIMSLAGKYGLYVIEDAAQAIESYYTGSDGIKKPLGSIGHLAAFSFHETKNIICGEGGMLVINDTQFINRAEIIWEKGTNRNAFFRGEIDKYNWVDIGSSFLLSDLLAAFLWAQIENISDIQLRRISIWQKYYQQLSQWAYMNNITLPFIPDYASNNGHMFYLVCNSNHERNLIIDCLKTNKILATFHYQNLASSPFMCNQSNNKKLKYVDRYSECLVRLPFFYDIKDDEVMLITELIKSIKLS